MEALSALPLHRTTYMCRWFIRCFRQSKSNWVTSNHWTSLFPSGVSKCSVFKYCKRYTFCHWLKTLEWNKLVRPLQEDGKHCVHDVLFLTFIRLVKGVSVHVTAYPCKIFVTAVNWALVNAQRNAARKWLLLQCNSWTDRTLPCCRLITMISQSSWHTSIPCFPIQCILFNISYYSIAS